MTFAILGMGTALPPTSIDRIEALRIARALCCRTEEQAAWLPSIYANSGVQSRRMVLGRALVDDLLQGTRRSGSEFLASGQSDDHGPTTGRRMRYYAELAPPLATQAAREALERSGVPARTLTHLVTVSCTGFLAPGLDWAVVRALGLQPTVQRTHIGFMGCHGAINGLRVAQAFSAADPAARVLVCAVELCSLHYHYGWDPQRIIANALFADGAAAVVGSATAGAPAGSWRVAATGSCQLPESTTAMCWTVGDHGFEMTLAKALPGLITTHLRPWLSAWLDRQGVSLADIGSWAIHPGGPAIIDAVEGALGLPASATAPSRAVLAECGNMSSPTVLFILDRLRTARAPAPCVALGFGPGVVVEAALLLA
jgi:predicted naringenin-chalcone synthase